MADAAGWESRIDRRMRLRDLHVLGAVVENGSMAKAADRLGITQSRSSQRVADLEHTLGVRLLERGPRGVEPTVYCGALLRYGRAAFDDLRQGIQEIESLKDPGLGEVRIGAPESVASALLPAIIKRFSQQYPRASVEVDTMAVPAAVPSLRERALDLAMALGGRASEDIFLAKDLKVEVLFNDELVVVADKRSLWGRRLKIDLAELAEAPWVLAPSGFSNDILARAFQARGLDMPKISLKTFSIHIRTSLTVGGRYLTTLPRTALDYYARQLPLKALPVALPAHPWPFVVVTLKGRIMSPMVERFIKCAREVASITRQQLPARS